MKINVRAAGFDTREGAPVLKISDGTMSMLVYRMTTRFEDAKSVTGERINGNLLPKGRIEPHEFDDAIENAKAFLQGYCPLTEHPAILMLIALIEFCKKHQCAVEWSKA